MNEINLRNSFNLISTSKIQETKWLRVLNQVSDGILVMQHTQNDNGIVLVNPVLRKMFANIKANDPKTKIERVGKRRVGSIFDEIF